MLTQGGDDYESPPTLQKFQDKKVSTRYTALTFEDIVRLLQLHRDAFIVTDTKRFKKSDVISAFEFVVSKTSAIDSEVLHRIVPQIYTERMLGYIEKIFKFNSYIFTLYKSHANNERVHDFSVKNGIEVIGMPAKKIEIEYSREYLELLNNSGIMTFLHTVNDLSRIAEFRKMDVYGFYTDFIAPGDLP